MRDQKRMRRRRIGKEEETLPKMKKEERYDITSKEDGRVSNMKILRRARKATSKKWNEL